MPSKYIVIGIFMCVATLQACTQVIASPPVVNYPKNTQAPPVAPIAAGNPATKLIRRANPLYPERAAFRGIEGWVLVDYTIDESGKVQNPKVISSYPDSVFDAAALNAIGQWLYEPHLENGNATPVENVQFRFKFQLAR